MKFTVITLLFALSLSSPLRAQTAGKTDALSALDPSLNDSAKAAALFSIGNRYYLEGMNDSALYCYTQSLNHATTIHHQQMICEAYLAMAKCNIHLQRQDEGIDLLFKCIAIAEREKMPKYRGNAKYLVSIIYGYQSKAKEALQFASDAEKDFIQLKDTAGLISLYPALIASLGKNGDTTSALGYFRSCLVLFNQYEASTAVSDEEKAHLPLKKMALIFNSADLMRKDEDLHLALEQVEQLGGPLLAGNNEYEKFEWYTLQAIINLRLKEYKASQVNAEQATKYIRAESGNYEQLGDVYNIIAQASSALGEYEKAYKAFELYKSYNDSIYKTNSIEAIHSVEAKYETAKKEERIKSLNREKNRQRVLVIVAVAGLLVAVGLLLFVSRAKRLQKKLFAREKEAQRTELEMKMFELEQTALRAQMNPHFIFNCLNSVQRYVISQDINGANKYLSNFASLIRKTLENSGKQFILLKDELQYLEAYVKMEQLRGDHHFLFDMQVEEGIDTSDISIPSMLVQPFVENSIQHGLRLAQEKKGTLRVTVSKTASLLITVEDNGPGIHHTKANDGHVSMGSSLTEKRIEVYNSLHEEKISLSITDRSEEATGETGTRVVLAFPIYNN